MLPLTVAAAETSVASLIISPARRILVLPRGALDDAMIDQVNRLLSQADAE